MEKSEEELQFHMERGAGQEENQFLDDARPKRALDARPKRALPRLHRWE